MPTESTPALISNDIVGLGLIAATLALIFWLASGPTPFWRKVFTWVPGLLLCYFVPAIYNTAGLIDGHGTKLYNPIARDVLLPAALVLLTLSIDLKGIARLGPKLLVMFVTGTVGIMLGALVSFQAMKLIHPPTVAGDTWAGMAALAGSWIGGGANMAAMRETFNVDATTFGQFAVVDVVCASILLMPALIWLAGRAQSIDARNGADTSAIDDMKRRIADYQARSARIPTLTDLMIIVGVGLGVVGAAHALAAPLAAWCSANLSFARQASLDNQFVWVVMLSTFAGLALSFTRARTGSGRRLADRHLVPVLPDRLHRHADGPAVAAGTAVAVPAGGDLDGHPRAAAVRGRAPAQGADVLPGHRFAGQCRRGRVGTGGGGGVPSQPRAGGRAARYGGLCHRHGAGLHHRVDAQVDGRRLTAIIRYPALRPRKNGGRLTAAFGLPGPAPGLQQQRKPLPPPKRASWRSRKKVL